eukprot:13704527-Ditylum_brightwellii.AAC.1
MQARAISHQYDAKRRPAGKSVEKASNKKQKAVFEFKFSLQKMPVATTNPDNAYPTNDAGTVAMAGNVTKDA